MDWFEASARGLHRLARSAGSRANMVDRTQLGPKSARSVLTHGGLPLSKLAAMLHHGHVVADGATAHSAEDWMVTSVMAGDAADHGAGQATCLRRTRTRQAERERKGEKSCFVHDKVLPEKTNYVRDGRR